MAKHEELVEKLYNKYVKPKGLPPRLAGQIKIALTDAAKKSKGDLKSTKAAIAAYLTERGYDPDSGKKLEKKAKVKKVKAKKEKKAKKTKKPVVEDDDDADEEEEDEEEEAPKKKVKKGASDPAKEKLEAAGAKKALKGDPELGVPKGNIDLRKLNRQTMKGMAKDLGVKYKKKWTDDELRTHVAKAMVGVDAEVTAQLAKADPAKIDALDDCLGVLLDLSKAICITCPAQEDCRKLFNQHKEDGFKIFQTLQPSAAPIPTTALVKKKNEVADTAAAPITVIKFGKVKELPSVKVDGVAVASNMEHKDFLRTLKSAAPMTTYEEFQKLVLANYDASEEPGGADKLVTWFLSYCTALGIVSTK